MANIKSAIKRNRTNERNRLRNVAVRTRMRTFIKRAMNAIESKDTEQVNQAVPTALSEIDRAASKGVIHPNSAARKKAMLQRRVSALSNSSLSAN